MTQQHAANITLASNIDLIQLASAVSFKFKHVIDLRTDSFGNAQPIKEQVLKRLKYLFVEYEQLPVDIAECSSERQSQTIKAMRHSRDKTLVLTNDISKLADLCMQSGIEFVSSELYVVESAVEIQLEQTATINADHVRHAVTAH